MSGEPRTVTEFPSKVRQQSCPRKGDATLSSSTSIPNCLDEKALETGQAASLTSSVLKYIVLEDLVHQYKKPCVMDIKMGKRQRKIGASAEKEQRQLEKSLRTTSHEVGFRLCGMQVR